MKYVLTIVIVAAALGAGAFLYAWSGIYDVAATEPHLAVTSSFIATLRDRSIAVRSDDIQVPDLDDAELKEAAFPHYHAMCRLCHGAPGDPPEELATGLYPAPPLMPSGQIQKKRSDAEIYWIVRHGIKLTGMPAFGHTHKEEELWGLAALAIEMPRMSPDQYKQIDEAARSEVESGRGHTHGGAEGKKDPGRGQGELSSDGKAQEEHH